jgi:hypothetical protein
MLTDPVLALIGAAIALLNPLFDAPRVVASIDILPALDVTVAPINCKKTPALIFEVTPLIFTPLVPAIATSEITPE